MLKTTKLVVPAALIMCVLAGLMLALGTRQTGQPVSVAVVDVVKVFMNLEERAAVEKELLERQAEMAAKLKAMEEKLKQLTKDIGIMGEGPERKAAVLERARLIIDARNEKDFGEQVYALDEGDEVRKMYNNIDAAVEEIAKQRGFHIVFSNDEQITIPEGLTKKEIERGASIKKMLFVDPGLDITADVITFMNNKFKANLPAGGAKPAAPAPARPAAPAPAGKKGP